MKCLHLLPKIIGLTLLIASSEAKAYDTKGLAWANGNILLELQLGVPDTVPLSDGSKTWDDVGLAAIDLWNPVLVRSRLVGVKASTVAKAKGNSLNNVFFSSDVYGTAFGDRTLALTQYYYKGVNIVEADVLVNSGKTWDSYRGNLQTKNDLQRVLLHEFGHVLGLNHPDQAKPPQTVAAIMNSVIGNLEALQSDDIAGVKLLYAAATVPLEGSLVGQTVTAGSPLTVTYSNDSPGASYYWAFKKLGGAASDIRMLTNGDGVPWNEKTYHLFSAEEDDAGTYYASAANFSGYSQYSTATVTINPVSKADGVLANLSTRGRAGSGSDTFIVGFVVSGTTKKSVLIRAIGPSLGAFGVAKTLADPKLTLKRKTGDSFVFVSDNDNWSEGPTGQVTTLRSTFQRLGAFALLETSKDSALLLDLDPGVYSAEVDAQGGTPGIALVEVYDADAHSDALQRPLINVSTRGYAGTGEEQLFAGFVVAGTSPKQVLIRAIGPGLTTYGVTGVNTDPNLVLTKDGVHIADNDDWALSNQGLDNILSPVFAKVGAFALDTVNPGWDSALLITLPPGAYSAQVSGRHDETGIVLLEVYEVPE